MFKKIIIALFAVLSIAACTSDNGIIHVENGQFIKHGKPYYFVGTNFWYGPILGSTGEGGNRERLARELDRLHELGLDNLRVLVGSDGNRGIVARVEPTLQERPGQYNDTLLVGLDYFLAELGKRDMEAVLYINNSWEWTGGYSQYLEWAGKGRAPIPAVDGYDAFRDYVSEYFKCDEARALFNTYVKDIVTRTNSVTGVKYCDDPAIFSWQIGNEPRPFGDDNDETFALWIGEVAKLIKELDPNHMVSIGSEGFYGCESHLDLYERICIYPEVDYINAHIWPFNWTWIHSDTMTEEIDNAIENTNKYIDMHIGVADKVGKPLTVEEFGSPSDGFRVEKEAGVTLRDTYYKAMFSRIVKASAEGSRFAGVNFWGWGGYAEPTPGHVYWMKGDDYCGDPAQEQQGLNSVFASDASTLAIISEANEAIKGNLAE